MAALSAGPGSDRARRLAAAARGLAAIDPNRAGTGGLRLQLELALFGSAEQPSPGFAVQPAVPAVESRPSAVQTPVTPPVPEDATAQATAASPTGGSAAPTRTRRETEPEDKAESEDKPAAAEPITAAAASEPSRPAASAEPSTPEAPPPSAVPTVEGDLGLLLTRWKEIVDSVRPATRAVITECRPMAVEGNIVTLGFPEAKGFLKDVADRKRPDLEAAVGGFLGRAVTVRCVATNVDIVPPAADADADFVLSEARRIFADDLVDVGEVS
jgi:hypothetical protein